MFLDEAFAEHGVRIVSPDRPGYGGSSRQPGRTLSDWPADIATLADALGVDRFGVIGGSGGGPYAAACCALLPERIIGGVVASSVIPPDWPGAGDRFAHIEDEDSAIAWCTDQFGADGRGFLESDVFEPDKWPEPDAAMLADETFARHLQEFTAEAFRQGVAGYAQDLAVLARPWPFDAAQISVPVRVIHGELDTGVPIEYGHQIAERIPGADFRELTGHGHASAMYEWPGVVSEFLSSVSRTADS